MKNKEYVYRVKHFYSLGLPNKQSIIDEVKRFLNSYITIDGYELINIQWLVNGKNRYECFITYRKTKYN